MLQPNCLLIKTASEISLKSHFVRKYFMKKLVSNIKSSLRANKLSGSRMVKKGGRIFLYSKPDSKLKKIIKILPFVFGIHSVALARQLDTTEKEEIVEEAVKATKNYFKKNNSFAVRANVVGKHSFSKRELNEATGSAILEKNPALKVNLTKPKKEIFVEVREKNSWIYLTQSRGFGGLPIGCEGNVAVFFEGKKAELLAGWLMMKRGCNIFPLVKGKSKKVFGHVNKLRKWNLGRSYKFTEEKRLQELAEKEDIAVQALVKADRKLQNFKKEDEKVQLPVFRPLVFYPEKLMKEKMQLVFK